eukprot:232653_1
MIMLVRILISLFVYRSSVRGGCVLEFWTDKDFSGLYNRFETSDTPNHIGSWNYDVIRNDQITSVRIYETSWVTGVPDRTTMCNAVLYEDENLGGDWLQIRSQNHVWSCADLSTQIWFTNNKAGTYTDSGKNWNDRISSFKLWS